MRDYDDKEVGFEQNNKAASRIMCRRSEAGVGAAPAGPLEAASMEKSERG